MCNFINFYSWLCLYDSKLSLFHYKIITISVKLCSAAVHLQLLGWLVVVRVRVRLCTLVAAGARARAAAALGRVHHAPLAALQTSAAQPWLA